MSFRTDGSGILSVTFADGVVRRVLGFGPVVVLPVEEELIERPTAFGRRRRTEAWLPEFELCSWFQAHERKNPGQDGSCLSLVWHQSVPHPFIAADVLPKMQAIRWLDVAEDFIL